MVIKTIEANRRQPAYLSDYIFIAKSLGNIMLCFIFGFFLSLFIEYPFTNLEKIIFKIVSRNDQDDVNGVNKTKNMKMKPIKLGYG